MAQTINTNISSLTAQRNATRTQNELSTAIARLSSGMRINSAKDDAAGMAISERFTSQIRGLNQASRNANDGISLAQVAEGGLSSVAGNLQRMRELAVQSANATNSTSDRAALQLEVAQLTAEIDRVSTQTQFNGMNVLDGTFTAQQFQVGANAGQTITIASINSARVASLGLYSGFNATAQSIGTASNTAVASTFSAGGTTYSLGTIATDAKVLATAITSNGISGLTATANATSIPAATQNVTGSAAGTAVITVNGLAINVNNALGGGAAATNRANAVAALNAQSAVTGVVATDTGSGVSLVAADGRNVSVAYSAGSANGSTIADFGMATGLTGSTLNLSYQAPSGVTGSVVFAGALALTVPIAATGAAVSSLDISTVAGANTALAAVDAALTQVNSSRAYLGAIQNRFSSTIENLTTSAENQTASRSRIQDADFAVETATLARAQILQQAGTAMIAQANQLPQQVLQLLK